MISDEQYEELIWLIQDAGFKPNFDLDWMNAMHEKYPWKNMFKEVERLIIYFTETKPRHIKDFKSTFRNWLVPYKERKKDYKQENKKQKDIQKQFAEARLNELKKEYPDARIVECENKYKIVIN